MSAARPTSGANGASLGSIEGEPKGALSRSRGAILGRTYTFVALTADGRSPFLDVRVFERGEDPAAHARRLLDEHRSCVRVEVWDGSVRRMTVGRDTVDQDKSDQEKSDQDKVDQDKNAPA
jgi:hypothetical protein